MHNNASSISIFFMLLVIIDMFSLVFVQYVVWRIWGFKYGNH